MPTFALTRVAINIVSGLGVTKVVSDIIRNNTVALTTSQKILVNAGGLVLGSMIVDQAQNHVNTTIDQLVEWRRQQLQKNAEYHQTHDMPTS